LGCNTELNENKISVGSLFAAMNARTCQQSRSQRSRELSLW
jgi:hypothetical protein